MQLAITYLGRYDLAHVQPEDLRGDAIHRDSKEPDFESEVVVEERMVDPGATENAFAPPRSDHIRPLKENGNGGNGNGGNGNGGNGHGHKQGNGSSEGHSEGGIALAPSLEERIRQARFKGYEGDPCSECGQLTLVRSGACCKCDTCGATSGCS